jgi:hypothetical protein
LCREKSAHKGNPSNGLNVKSVPHNRITAAKKTTPHQSGALLQEDNELVAIAIFLINTAHRNSSDQAFPFPHPELRT